MFSYNLRFHKTHKNTKINLSAIYHYVYVQIIKV